MHWRKEKIKKDKSDVTYNVYLYILIIFLLHFYIFFRLIKYKINKLIYKIWLLRRFNKNMLAIQFQFSIYASNRGKYSPLTSNRTIRLVIPRHGIRIYRVPLLGIGRSFWSKLHSNPIAAGTYVKSLGEAYCSKLRRERKECTSEIRRGITASLAQVRLDLFLRENLISY